MLNYFCVNEQTPKYVRKYLTNEGYNLCIKRQINADC